MDYPQDTRQDITDEEEFDKLFQVYIQRVSQHYEANKSVQVAVKKLQKLVTKHH